MRSARQAFPVLVLAWIGLLFVSARFGGAAEEKPIFEAAPYKQRKGAAAGSSVSKEDKSTTQAKSLSHGVRDTGGKIVAQAGAKGADSAKTTSAKPEVPVFTPRPLRSGIKEKAVSDGGESPASEPASVSGSADASAAEDEGVKNEGPKPVYTPHTSRKEPKPGTAAEGYGAEVAAASGPAGSDSADARKKKYVYQGSAKGKRVALTFDDGPNPKITPDLLHYLKENGIPATFFLVGEQVQKNPSLAIEISELGFEIGNHTWNHPNLGKADNARVKEEIQSTSEEIQRVTGKTPTLLRPPYGVAGKKALDVSEPMGLTIVMWSIDTNDWRGRSTDEIVATVEKELKPGSIILMHDNRKTTFDAVPRIVDLVKARGLELATVSELIAELKDPPAAANVPAAPGAAMP